MIGHLKGSLIDKTPTRILLDVHGVGYDVQIPLSTFEKLGTIGEEAALLTYLHVREEALTLFGFATAAEKQLFQLLLAVSGVGPRIAQSILSGTSVEAFRQKVQRGEVSALTTIPGIGRKTAERIIVELRDKIGSLPDEVWRLGADRARVSAQEQALQALISLGYARAASQKAVERAVQENPQAAVEDVIKSALRHV